ncbi:MAG: hypothetical protein OJI67_06430, partial [Prosthecobacter sp.]|nr:hypothetical protein [Prosthecobacter sp.]
RFKALATVCKYAVPVGYPDGPGKRSLIDVSTVVNSEQLYYAAVDEAGDKLYATGSRTVAVLGIAPTLAEAEAMAEADISRVQGALYHREDIGTAGLVNRRIQMMQTLRPEEAVSS